MRWARAASSPALVAGVRATTGGCSSRSRGSTAAPARSSRARRPTTSDQTLRDFLDQGRFIAGFVRHFMEPLVAAVWSCDPATSLDYPARYLFTFLEHHGMLGVFGSPEWRTVTGGSGTYVAAVAAGSSTTYASRPR